MFEGIKWYESCLMSVTKIPFDVFLRTKAAVDTISHNIQQKRDWLNTTFKCFSEQPSSVYSGDSKPHTSQKWKSNASNGAHGQHGHGHGQGHANRYGNNSRVRKSHCVGSARLVERPRIGGPKDANEHSQIKREFTSVMNKMTSANSAKLVCALRTVMKHEYVDVYVPVVWDMMMRSLDHQQCYIEVLRIVECSTQLNDIFDDYVDKQRWLPDANAVPTTEYDEFCDFIKWKKRSVLFVHGMFALEQNDMVDRVRREGLITMILNDVQSMLDMSPQPTCLLHIQTTNALLEQVMSMIVCSPDTHHVLRSLFLRYHSSGLHAYAPMIRFKIQDVVEKLT
jgi:hypothetical protein